MFRIIYSLLILSIILPFGPGRSGWTSLAIGQGAISRIGILTLFAIGIYRIVTVASSNHTLDSPIVSGIPSFLKLFGKILIYVGLISSILSLVATLLVKPSPNANGIEYFLIGIISYILSGVGLLGLICYETGRIRSFEIDSSSRV